MNQRKIKFRVWDKEENKFLLPEWADGMAITLNGEVGHYSNIDDNDDGVIQNGKWYFPEQKFITGMYELSQYTGLKDSNGKDIYEGDIVKHKFRRSWQTKDHVSKVIWNQEWSCYYLFDGISNHRMRDDITYEIIGNIYQNPTLFK